MPRARLVLATVLFAACSEPTPNDDTATATGTSTGAADDPEPHATFAAKLDAIALCGFEGATAIRFIARRVGCEQAPPAPCTLEVSPYREWDGDVIACPSGQTLLDVEVAVPVTGRFQIDAKVATTSGFQSLCFGLDATVPTLVSAADLEARRELYVTTTSKPCPAP
ncbi:hypothetical protein [Nannocystis sp.]|uniref:hypothetical protein n=1 Tax=Nannocystis sp. TaxID=1962667 RepID=UPI002422FE65|nr:hypothetical protein [Nannocystis sp.]MBK7826385.1 hypothetical protein [Nannocystis sp.]MBK9757901.1 hypothetical protein [Nannocystis sp.]